MDDSAQSSTSADSLAPDWMTSDWRSWPLLLRRVEVAALARVCPRTIARATASGLLPIATPAYALAKYHRADVARFLGLEVTAHG